MKKEKGIRIKPRVKEEITGFLFAMPVILGLLIFTFLPAIQGFIYAFFNFDGFNMGEFVGFGNFVRFFAKDRDTVYIFRNSFLYAIINVPLSLVLGYLVALLVNTQMKGIKVFRTLFLPSLRYSRRRFGSLWQDLFAANGIINQILTNFGLPAATFFSEAKSSMATYIWTTTWGVGGSMVLWLASFKNIPSTLYEAAILDGANWAKKLWYITIPMSTAMIFYNLVTGIIGALQLFNTYIVASGTNGKGEGNSLYVFAVKIYNTAFVGTNPQVGYAAAIGIVLFVIIMILTAITFKTNKWVHYSEGD